MSDYNDYARLLHQMQSFRASDEAREQFVSEILAKYQALAEEHTNLKNDYLSERDIRRNYQRTVDEKQALVGDHERQLQASSFVLALIDGDGAIFQDALLQAAGGDGGSEAASRLYHAIRAHVASLYNNSANWHIMVQICLSLDKLAMKLASIGLLRSPQEFRAFAQSFNVNQPLFSIIDVGQGKERADHKIKEMLRTFSDNPTCRHIIFGGCHDAGYLVNLEKFKHDMVKASQITLLETTPAYRGFNDLINFKRTRFDDVFKNEPLPDYVPPSNEFNQLAVQSPVPLAVQPPNRSNSNNNNASPTMISRLITSPSPSVTPLSSVTPAESSKDSSWATVGKAGAPTNGSISIAPTTTATTKKSKKKYAYYNKAEQRLDEPLPPKDPAAAASLEMRMKKSGKKMCNHWHLGGYCENGSFCTFQHEPKLTPGELNALRYKTRSLACKNRYCDNIDCYLGHQCALERDQGWCPYPENCHLRATHGMDRVRYVRYDKDGNADYAP
ncbi:c-x8-c-x5-c-x3-h type zinc finger [Pyrenophora seminiperda CCB06]|uniref:C-x8-c-x5-c-x3-h type zinc finger n=1 Tax=Pyrenophora seminiperda CCB06 TaxID=1302712 RepID=A0A3M7LY33_9PLEO|nr:c-x8-c-x5-c-x3-h type zinc finger [Pyrenophora seminiperda CCB06]